MGYQLVMDNVDVIVHPRYTSRKQHGTDHHMVQMIAIQNRVKSHHLPNNDHITTVDKIDVSEFLPTVSDDIICENIPAHITSPIYHKHMAELQQKSKIVSINYVLCTLKNFKNRRIECPQKEKPKNKKNRVRIHKCPASQSVSGH